LLGNEVQTVFQDVRFQAGIHSVCVNAGRLASGVYFYRLELDDSYIQTKKMCILK
jgi:hypothetical protein